ncbi:MAG: flagellar biosynthetic protein FliR [bacterium]|nr:flagellar biosynthetic protein FliR [bacterium]
MEGSTTYLLSELFSFFLILARMGALLTTLPGTAEKYVPGNVRLLLAFSISLVLTPTLSPKMPGLPSSSFGFFLMISGEMLVGFMIGLLSRTLISALDVAGTVMGFQMSLSNAFVQNPISGQQSSLPSLFLTMTATLLIFMTGLHHLILHAFVSSYDLLPSGNFPKAEILFGSMAELFLNALKSAFVLSLKVSAPLILVGLIFFAAIGLVNRLVPNIQVFFVSMPLHILLGFIVILITITTLIPTFLNFFENTFTQLIEGFRNV